MQFRQILPPAYLFVSLLLMVVLHFLCPVRKLVRRWI